MSDPVRTCVGCRRRDAQSTLLRVVLHEASSRGSPSVTPDPARRAPGRGAYVHVDQACVNAAVARRAFGRTFRRGGILDTTAVVRWVEQRA